MANEPVPPVPDPQLPESSSPVLPVDWFLRMPNGGATVYVRSAD